MQPGATSKPRCLCGALDYRLVLDGGEFSVIECRRCGLARTDPVPEIDEAIGSEEAAKCVDGYLKNAVLFRGLMDRFLDEVCDFQKGGRFLDVGCAVGYLTERALARGFDAFGIEAHPRSYEIARERLGDRIRHGLFDADLLERDSFDVVAIRDTVEHLSDPAAVFRDCLKLLKPGGILALTAPNFAGWVARREGASWVGLQPVGHIWQYGSDTLCRILQDAGFRIERVRFDNLWRPYRRSVRRALRRLVYSLAAKVGQGDYMYVIARKPTEQVS